MLKCLFLLQSVADFQPRKRSKSRGRSRSRGRTGRRSPGRTNRQPEPEIVKEKVVQAPIKQLDLEPLILNTNTPLPDVTPRSRVIPSDYVAPRTSTPTRHSPRLADSKDKVTDTSHVSLLLQSCCYKYCTKSMCIL